MNKSFAARHQLVEPDNLRKPLIDYLRVLAISLVMISHGNNILIAIFHRKLYTPPPYGYGFYGVALFFLLSGYSIHARHAESLYLGQYLKRRITKILPWYWVSIAVAFCIPLTTLPKLNWAGYAALLTGFYEYMTRLGLSDFLCTVKVSKYNNINGVTWFVGPLFIVYFLYPVLRKLVKNKNSIYYSIFLILILLIFWRSFYNLGLWLLLFFTGMLMTKVSLPDVSSNRVISFISANTLVIFLFHKQLPTSFNDVFIKVGAGFYTTAFLVFLSYSFFSLIFVFLGYFAKNIWGKFSNMFHSMYEEV